MAKKYRKKPIVVEAFKLFYIPGYHLTKDHLTKLPNWFQKAIDKFSGERGSVFCHANGYLVVSTSEGLLEITPGDYVIQDIEGELYPCKPDIFEASYEPA